jgi:hypothetical protein
VRINWEWAGKRRVGGGKNLIEKIYWKHDDERQRQRQRHGKEETWKAIFNKQIYF